MDYKYDTRQGTHGVSYGAFAQIKTTTEGVIDTSVTVTPMTGLRNVNIETTTEESPFYADNVKHLTLSGAPTTEGSITVYQFNEDFVLKHLGKKKMTNTGLVDTGVSENFIFQYIRTLVDEFGKTKRQLVIYYNLKASPPTGEDATDEDSAELKEYEIPVTGSPNNLVLDSDGNSVTTMVVTEDDTNTKLIDLAYKQLILPTTAIPESV